MRGAIFFAFVLLLVALRRPNHFMYPAPWIEDGSVVMGQTLSLGWASIFLPLYGYLIVPARLISILATAISFEHYAIVAIVMACIVHAAVITAVAFAPTTLPHKLLCALALACLPIDPEVFATPLYTFWWTSIPLFLALMWTNDAGQWPRYVFAAIAGVSSPLIVLLSPLFVLRAALDRTVGNSIAAVVVVGFALLQFTHLRAGDSASLLLDLPTFAGVIANIIGYPFAPLGVVPGFIWGAITIGVLAVGLLIVPRSERPHYLLLGLALGAVGLGMAQRVDVYVLNALTAGPRYFFFPVTVLVWLLLWVLVRGVNRWRFIALIPLVVLVPWTIRTYVRWHEPLPKTWEQQARECAATEGAYEILVQFDGYAERAWKGTLNGPDCKRALEGSLIR